MVLVGVECEVEVCIRDVESSRGYGDVCWNQIVEYGICWDRVEKAGKGWNRMELDRISWNRKE